MAQSEHVRHLFDTSGKLYAVMISASLWERNQSRLESVLGGMLEAMEPAIRPEPMDEWEAFKIHWDYKYPYCADVRCGHCNARTDDWPSDPAKLFRLKSAQLGGLVVFRCNCCGATVRKKHFTDHICFEFSPGSNPGR